MALLGTLLAVAGCPMRPATPGGNDNNTNAAEPNDNAANDNAANDNAGNDNAAITDNTNANDAGGPTAARSFRATLSGDAQVPPIDTETTGSIKMDYNPATGELTYSLNVANGVGITAAHIHLGQPDENGGVIASLFGPADPPVNVNGILMSGTLTADDLLDGFEGRPLSEIIGEMAAGNTYVNVHSEANPGGEVRGQIAEVS